MFSQNVVNQTIRIARINRINPAALLAVVEVESNGQPFELDNRTPRFLFERHVFYRELKKRAPNKLKRAVDLGLAIPKWNRSVQYRDQGTSRGRLALLEKARSVDAECANRSCSWGVGQTMGFLAEEHGYESATKMVSAMITGGVTAQIECMVTEIKNKKLLDKINKRDWAGFARVYNGPGYAANQYDTRMATAFVRWKNKLEAVPPPPDIEEPDTTPTPPPLTPDEPIDIPPTRENDDKPASHSKTIWAQIMMVLTSIAGYATDWKFLAVMLIAALAVFVILERTKRTDIVGWL
jgi:hypothetical protein